MAIRIWLTEGIILKRCLAYGAMQSFYLVAEVLMARP
jgi:hypothetical protein